MGLKKRLEALEAQFGGGPPGCPECGGGGGGPVTFTFGGALGPGEEFVQEYCPSCGCEMNFTMKIDLPRGELLLEEEVDD